VSDWSARLQAVEARLAAGDVGGDDALTDVLELEIALADFRAQPEATAIAMDFHRERLSRLTPPHDELDHHATLTLLVVLFAAAPEHVPSGLRARFEREGPPPLGELLLEWATLVLGAAQERGNLTLFRHAAMLGEQAAAIDGPSLLSRAIVADALYHRYLRTDELDVLDREVALRAESVRETGVDDPAYPRQCSALGTALDRRSGRTGSREELDEAIAWFRRGLEHADREDRPSLLTNLSGALKRRGDPDLAIAAAREAVALSAEDEPALTGRLTNLASALMEQHLQSADPRALSESIEHFRAVVQRTPVGHPRRALRLGNLARALLSSEEDHFDVVSDEAVTIARAAVEASVRGETERPKHQERLAQALVARFWISGRPGDLDEAVAAAEDALAQLPPGHPDRGSIEVHLSAALQARFRQTGGLADINEAVLRLRRRISTDGETATLLSELARALTARSQRTPGDEDIDSAIDAGRRALAIASTPGRLMDLSSALYERDRSSPDLDEALTLAHEAVRLTRRTDPAWLVFRRNLANLLSVKARRTHARTDLDATVDAARDVVSCSRPDEVYWADQQRLLADALYVRHQHHPAQEDLEEALTLWTGVLEAPAAPVHDRLRAAHMIGGANAVERRWPQAADGFTHAVRLVTELGLHGLQREDQQAALFDTTGYATDGAAFCLKAGDARRALNLLEQGRGVLLAQALDARSDLSDLAARQPELARRVDTLRVALRSATQDGLRGEAERRRSQAAEFAHLLAEIRGLEGFEHFLRTPAIESLPYDDGIVAVINLCAVRCDALLISSTGIEVVPLQRLHPGVVAEQAEYFLNALATERADRAVSHVLRWLWDEVTGPVIEHLVQRDAVPPRIWWCPTGLLALMPLHAAGYHETAADPEPRTVMDRTVSSYTPTLRALAYARRPRTRTHPPRVVVAAMPSTPGAADLPGAALEALLVSQRFGERATVLEDPRAAELLAALPEHDIAHFACHAQADLDHSSEGRLLLADGPLSVGEVSALHLEHAELAYLSACSTAVGGLRLPDEAIHLASAFQLAGFRHVVGTLWPIADSAAVSLAARVYEGIARDGSADATAVSLHEAMRALRAKVPERPSLWASHVHVGA
jgi:tetratricopeptide (TPR) repeat protein